MLACLFAIFKENAPWIWENLDNCSINNLLKEHTEISRSPEDRHQEQMEAILQETLANNPLVQAFMNGNLNLNKDPKK